MRGISLLLTSLAAAGSIATAPPPPKPPQSEDILVVGVRDSAQARRDFVRSLALPSADKQLARFYDPVCPFVAGLSDRSNALVVRRMRQVATASGMRVAREPCTPNALLYVVADKPKLLERWRKSDSPLFGDEMSDGQIRALAHSAEPASSWQLLDYRGSDGRTLSKIRIARPKSLGKMEPLSVDFSPASAIEHDWAPISRIINPLRIGFGASVLVVDGRAAGGANLTQLADFAAMQLFAHTRVQTGAAQPAPTILTLLDDAETGRPAPLSMTEWDLAYLKALYSYSDMYVAGAHKGELAKRMGRFIPSDTADK